MGARCPEDVAEARALLGAAAALRSWGLSTVIWGREHACGLAGVPTSAGDPRQLMNAGPPAPLFPKASHLGCPQNLHAGT